MIKFLIGGSPCTHWSIAQSKDRETTAEGIGWELFRNYLIAKEKFNPDFFLYENNKSAAPAIKDQIAVELGVPLQYINSALVSAQNRQRFYCHNFGDVPQPADRGILLRDILESGMQGRVNVGYPVGDVKGKAYCLTDNYKNGPYPEHTLSKGVRTMVAIPVNPVDYAPHSNSDIVITENSMQLQRQDTKHSTIQGSHVTFDDAKAQTLGTSHIPMAFEQLTFEAIADKEKAECLRATYDHSGARNFEENIIRSKGYEGVAVRIGCLPDAKGNVKNSQAKRIYDIYGKSVPLCACENGGGSSDQSGNRTGLYAVPVRIGTIENNAQNAEFDSQQYRVYSPCGKSVTICGQGGGVGAKTGLYACPIETNAPVRPIYEVQGGLITIKEKQYPIKLPDGYYIIRKLTVTECCRLQTMPDDYCRAVSATQGYKGLGNGWTAEVIMHILRHANVPLDEEIVVLSMYDGIGTGRYCFDALGYKNVTYYAYEIDKYPIQIAMSNYSDIIQCGDAFGVRADNWELPQMHFDMAVNQ